MTTACIKLSVLVQRVIGHRIGNLVVILADPFVETRVAVAPWIGLIVSRVFLRNGQSVRHAEVLGEFVVEVDIKLIAVNITVPLRREHAIHDSVESDGRGVCRNRDKQRLLNICTGPVVCEEHPVDLGPGHQALLARRLGQVDHLFQGRSGFLAILRIERLVAGGLIVHQRTAGIQLAFSQYRQRREFGQSPAVVALSVGAVFLFIPVQRQKLECLGQILLNLIGALLKFQAGQIDDRLGSLVELIDIRHTAPILHDIEMAIGPEEEQLAADDFFLVLGSIHLVQISQAFICQIDAIPRAVPDTTIFSGSIGVQQVIRIFRTGDTEHIAADIVIPCPIVAVVEIADGRIIPLHIGLVAYRADRVAVPGRNEMRIHTLDESLKIFKVLEQLLFRHTCVRRLVEVLLTTAQKYETSRKNNRHRKFCPVYYIFHNPLKFKVNTNIEAFRIRVERTVTDLTIIGQLFRPEAKVIAVDINPQTGKPQFL